MKSQWVLIMGIFFALLVAIFAVINVESVTVNYFFGTAEWPLILVILGSVFMGGIIVGTVGFFRTYSFHKQVKLLTKENEELTAQLQKKNKVKAPKVEAKKEDVKKEEMNNEQVKPIQ